MSDYTLELQGITKVFPGVKALDGVNFQLREGEIHALMGENGAGKSTFIKVITGVHHAEEGEMYVDGQRVDFKSPLDAQKLGIAAIYQHVTSYPHLTVTENVFMGHEIVKHSVIQWKEMNRLVGELLKELDADFQPTATMGSLSVAQQQMVEIAKALSTNARIIIMDEPTAALTRNESEELYRITEKLRDDGKSVIFISHRLEDMYRLASRVTVFRDAHYIGTYNVAEIQPPELIKSMVGREIKDLFPKPEIKPGKEVLRVEHLGRSGYFKDVSFNIRAGEIVGLTGLVGAGRTEVVQTIYGVEHYAKLNLVEISYGDDMYQMSVDKTQALLQNYPDLKLINAPTTVGINAAAKVIDDEGLQGKVIVTGLGLPSEMADYMTGDKPACPYMFLWNPIDVGRVAGYTLIEMVNGSLTGALGESFTAADGNTYTVTEAGDGGTEIIIGPPFRFDTENIEEWAQVY